MTCSTLMPLSKASMCYTRYSFITFIFEYDKLELSLQMYLLSFISNSYLLTDLYKRITIYTNTPFVYFALPVTLLYLFTSVLAAVSIFLQLSLKKEADMSCKMTRVLSCNEQMLCSRRRMSVFVVSEIRDVDEDAKLAYRVVCCHYRCSIACLLFALLQLLALLLLL